MPLSKLWPGFAVGLLLIAAAGCGSTSTTTTPAAPTATPAAGAVNLAFTVAPAPTPAASSTTIAFVAETQVATVNATQANYSGTFTAALTGCGTAVTLGGTSPAFTVTAVGPIASGCSITVTGGNSMTASLGIPVPAPGPLQVNWGANAALGTAVAGQTITPGPGPINLIGVTSTYGAELVVSKTAYIGTFNAVTTSAPCAAAITATPAAPSTTTPATAGGTIAVLGSAQAYVPVVGVAPIATSGGCTITVTDNAVNTVPANGTATIGVSVTTSTGGIQ